MGCVSTECWILRPTYIHVSVLKAALIATFSQQAIQDQFTLIASLLQAIHQSHLATDQIGCPIVIQEVKTCTTLHLHLASSSCHDAASARPAAAAANCCCCCTPAAAAVSVRTLQLFLISCCSSSGPWSVRKVALAAGDVIRGLRVRRQVIRAAELSLLLLLLLASVAASAAARSAVTVPSLAATAG